jgi:hypothetical protein
MQANQPTRVEAPPPFPESITIEQLKSFKLRITLGIFILFGLGIGILVQTIYGVDSRFPLIITCVSSMISVPLTDFLSDCLVASRIRKYEKELLACFATRIGRGELLSKIFIKKKLDDLSIVKCLIK